MFEDLIRQLEEIERTRQLSFDIKPDKDGYMDKECPSKECEFQFKVYVEDWANLFQDEAVYCPLCRHEAPSDHWYTTEQIEGAHNQAVKYVASKINQGLVDSARRFNASQSRNSFIKMSMTVTGANTYFVKVPLPALEEMTLKIQCENCNARFAVVGSAFFCPCCGHNSVEKTFDKVEGKLNNLNLIRQSLIAEGLKDEAETTCRSLIETGLSDCVVAFQRYSEEVYKNQPGAEKVSFNAFQRIEDGSGYWERLIGEGYKDWLSPEEMNRLNLLFQRRHLLAHTEGMVDDRYLARSGDTTYRAGQRIVVSEKDVRETLGLIRKIVTGIRGKIV